MILSFKKQFKQPILDGTKIHTIREDKSGRWKAGNSIQMATGVRTKQYNCFKESECISTQEIHIIYQPGIGIPAIYIDGMDMWKYGGIADLARNDGFKNLPEFLDWFSSDFKGKIIHWTDKRY